MNPSRQTNLSKARSSSRRAFLRGLGVSMALPWLESLPVWGEETVPGTAANRVATEPPVRFACIFSGNGFHKREWRATAVT